MKLILILSFFSFSSYAGEKTYIIKPIVSDTMKEIFEEKALVEFEQAIIISIIYLKQAKALGGNEESLNLLSKILKNTPFIKKEEIQKTLKLSFESAKEIRTFKDQILPTYSFSKPTAINKALTHLIKYHESNLKEALNKENIDLAPLELAEEMIKNLAYFELEKGIVNAIIDLNKAEVFQSEIASKMKKEIFKFKKLLPSLEKQSLTDIKSLSFKTTEDILNFEENPFSKPNETHLFKLTNPHEKILTQIIKPLTRMLYLEAFITGSFGSFNKSLFYLQESASLGYPDAKVTLAGLDLTGKILTNNEIPEVELKLKIPTNYRKIITKHLQKNLFSLEQSFKNKGNKKVSQIFHKIPESLSLKTETCKGVVLRMKAN